MNKTSMRLLPAALLAAMTLTVPQTATAAPSGPYQACEGFDVTIESTGGTQATRMTRIKDGVLYSITAGKGTTITVTNVDSLKSVTFGTKGSVTRYAIDQDGNIQFSLSGANLLLLFKDVDVGGPSTILYTGLVRFTTDSSGTLHEPIQQASGTQRDICEELK
ncbi:hypothetical protein ACFYLX_13655 [Pseudarthrobacter enclensis]|uniref:hypothetical protein n=1 Tax=Pseudarthrobacter enclensis TaxID=993070 RepID=UPI0036768C27